MEIQGNFSPNFIGEIEKDTRKENQKATNIADAVRDLRDSDFSTWDEMARSVFFKPGRNLDIEEVINKILETNIADGPEVPVGIYIDPAGEYQVQVWDDPNNNFESVCSYCKRIIRAGEGKTSHGICWSCYERETGESSGKRLVVKNRRNTNQVYFEMLYPQKRIISSDDIIRLANDLKCGAEVNLEKDSWPYNPKCDHSESESVYEDDDVRQSKSKVFTDVYEAINYLADTGEATINPDPVLENEDILNRNPYPIEYRYSPEEFVCPHCGTHYAHPTKYLMSYKDMCWQCRHLLYSEKAPWMGEGAYDVKLLAYFLSRKKFSESYANKWAQERGLRRGYRHKYTKDYYVYPQQSDEIIETLQDKGVVKNYEFEPGMIVSYCDKKLFDKISEEVRIRRAKRIRVEDI